MSGLSEITILNHQPSNFPACLCVRLKGVEGRKGSLYFWEVGEKREADHVCAFIKRRQVTQWYDRISASLFLGGLWPISWRPLRARSEKGQEWPKGGPPGWP